MTDEHTESRAEACPFCASLVICRSGFALSCYHCGATGPDADENTFDLALEQWNRRDGSRARIASLTAERDALTAELAIIEDVHAVALEEIEKADAERDELKLAMEALVDLTRESAEQLRQERDEARARVAVLEAAARYVNARGGCGYDVHDRLNAALSTTQPAPLKLEPKP